VLLERLIPFVKISNRIILDDFYKAHPDSCKALHDWLNVVKETQWKTPVDVLATYRKADPAGNFMVFNIRGNKYRLIVDITYSLQLVRLKYILTHAEYDKGNWKNDHFY
jgi:mRNA interferase HigB